MAVNVTVNDQGLQRKLDIIRRGMPKLMRQILMQVGAEGTTFMKEEVPVATGTLKASIDEKLVSNQLVIIQPHENYAAFVQWGTRYQAANPYATRTADRLDQVVDEVIELTINQFIEQEGLDR